MTDLSTTFFIFTQFLSLLDGLDELFHLGLVERVLLITEVAAGLGLALLVVPRPAAISAVLHRGGLQDFHLEFA